MYISQFNCFLNFLDNLNNAVRAYNEEYQAQKEITKNAMFAYLTELQKQVYAYAKLNVACLHAEMSNGNVYKFGKAIITKIHAATWPEMPVNPSVYVPSQARVDLKYKSGNISTRIVDVRKIQLYTEPETLKDNIEYQV